jgi:hypothetical protein
MENSEEKKEEGKEKIVTGNSGESDGDNCEDWIYDPKLIDMYLVDDMEFYVIDGDLEFFGEDVKNKVRVDLSEFVEEYEFDYADIPEVVYFGKNSYTTTVVGSFEGSCIVEVTIPKSIIKIEDGAFESCQNLRKIYLDIEKPLPIAESVFEGVNKDECTLFVPKGCVEAYRNAPCWKSFKHIEEDNREDNRGEAEERSE